MEALEDELSSLPDDILINILSRLRIDYAAATSILCRRWQFLWTRREIISLYKYDFMSPDIMYIYKTFNRISQQLSFYKIDEFNLNAPYPITDSLDECSTAINSLIHQLSQRQVHEIYISVDTINYEDLKDDGQVYQPVRVHGLNNRHLVSLELRGMLEINDSFNLPNLEKLSLSVQSLHWEVFNNLTKSSPKLKRLSVSGKITGVSTSSICLSSQKLKYLDLNISVEFVHDGEFVIGGEFVMDTPNLKQLVLEKLCRDKYRFVCKPSKLMSIDICLWSSYILNPGYVLSHAIEFLRGISNVIICLTIDDGIVKAFKSLNHNNGRLLYDLKCIGTLIIKLSGSEGN